MNTIAVLTHSKNYYVHIGTGLLDCAGELSLTRCAPGPAVVVSDSNVAPLYASRVVKSLAGAGFSPELYVIPAGESSKSAGRLLALLSYMAQRRMTRNSTVFALGGGVTGDLAGLAASLYMRGTGFVQLPTSLLAAVDSSVGGKTAIDLAEGKNLVGTFYQPDLVLCDTGAFSTLPEQQTANGFGEIIKTGMICDEKLFDTASHAEAVRHIGEIVTRCVEIKKSIVERDERETGGLRDSVQPYNQFTGEGTGFSFANFNAYELADAIRRALALYHNEHDAYCRVQRQAMSQDFSFTRSAEDYAHLYLLLLPPVSSAAEQSLHKDLDAYGNQNNTADNVSPALKLRSEGSPDNQSRV